MTQIEDLLHRRTDLSTFLVHLTRDDRGAARDNLLDILANRTIEARRVYGMATDLAREMPEIERTQQVACFTETPLEYVWMMCQDISTRGVQLRGYGLAFTKAYARKKGVNPVCTSTSHLAMAGSHRP
ncbi:hypothetical protein GCM10023224_14070 [Streptomonospora halophila]|uniref:Uncharacterized protein n=1 Tax=Streptomonospora halophila TaxID=427369 RepID=A0ABP9G9W4_9ACTN